MTDFEMTRLCAEAMGYSVPNPEIDSEEDKLSVYESAAEGTHRHHWYWPLTDDTQAMALVKRFNLKLEKSWDFLPSQWWVTGPDNEWHSADLNRAIVECIAKMQVDRTASKAVATSEVK